MVQPNLAAPVLQPSQNWYDLFDPRSRGERLIGVHLSPLRCFADHLPLEPLAFTEVIRKATTSGAEVLVTRLGGLFMKPPMRLADPYRTHPDDFQTDRKMKEAFQYEAARYLNEFICELALNGLISEPASPASLAYGQLVENHALITVAALPDSPDCQMDRTIWPSLLLKDGGQANIQSIHSENTLDASCMMVHSPKLIEISRILPTLVSSAYYSYWRGLDPEAISTGWVVIEQIVDHLWKKMVSQIADEKRKGRLLDVHVYSAAVRLEILMRNQDISEDQGKSAHIARRARNKLIHQTHLPSDAAEKVLTIMHRMLEHICGSSLKPPTRNIRPVW